MFYWIAKYILSIYFHVVYRIKVKNLNNIPKKGGVIVCSNHESVLDPMLIGIIINRRISFMAKKELFNNKFYGLVLRHLDSFPVERDIADLQAYKKAIKLLKSGKALGIFAQGTRSKNIDTKEGKGGAVFFALNSGVPIVPVGIKVKKKFFTTVEFNCGDAIDYSEYKNIKLKTEVLNELTEDLMEKINVLRG